MNRNFKRLAYASEAVFYYINRGSQVSYVVVNGDHYDLRATRKLYGKRENHRGSCFAESMNMVCGFLMTEDADIKTFQARHSQRTKRLKVLPEVDGRKRRRQINASHDSRLDDVLEWCQTIKEEPQYSKTTKDTLKKLEAWAEIESNTHAYLGWFTEPEGRDDRGIHCITVSKEGTMFRIHDNNFLRLELTNTRRILECSKDKLSTLVEHVFRIYKDNNALHESQFRLINFVSQENGRSKTLR